MQMTVFKSARIVTLTSDFGTTDGYVGAMKGVLKQVAPSLRIVDLGHELPPQDIDAGSALLSHATRWFPWGTVHLAVVDPGVGTARAPIVVASRNHLFVGPDNGLFSHVLQDPHAQVRAIDDRGSLRSLMPPNRSSTFHGRDMFAPVAGWLATGMVRFQDVGPLAQAHVRDLAVPIRMGNTLSAIVTAVDRFGNCITNVNPQTLPKLKDSEGVVQVQGGPVVPWVNTYADVEHGEFLALVGSGGFLEIARRDGSAADALKLGRGTSVTIRFP
jgi:S-adenosylmethionine hydrolase